MAKVVMRKTNREHGSSRFLVLERALYCTVKVTGALTMVPDVAVTLAVEPDVAVETTVANPVESIVATVLSVVAQVTEFVMTAVEPSE